MSKRPVRGVCRGLATGTEDDSLTTNEEKIMTTLLTVSEVQEVQEQRDQNILDLEQMIKALPSDEGKAELVQRLQDLKVQRKYQWFSYYNFSDQFLEEVDLREIKVQHLWNILYLVMTRQQAQKFDIVLDEIYQRGVIAVNFPLAVYVAQLHKKDAAQAWRFANLQTEDEVNVYQFFKSLYHHAHNIDKFNNYFYSARELLIKSGM